MRLPFALRRSLSITALAGLALGMALNAQADTDLRIGYQKSSTLLALLKAQGTLEKQLAGQGVNITWHEFTSGLPLAESLNVGNVDISADVADTVPVFAQAAGAQLTYFASETPSPAAQSIVIPKDSPLKSLADLKGKRIAVNRGGWGHFMALGALRRAGLKPEDVTFSFLGPVDGRAALVRGSVDAWVPWEPYTSSAVLLDGARVIDNGDGIMTGYSYALASDAAIAAKQEAISDLMTRLARAQVWALQHPDAFAAALAKDLNMPQEVTRRWVGEARISPIVFDERIAATLQKAADFFHGEGVLPKALNVSPAFDFSLSRGAAEVARTLPADLAVGQR